MTQATEPEPLATLIERAVAFAKAQPEDVRLAMRQRALDRMLQDRNVGPDGPDKQLLRRYLIAEAVLELRRRES